VPPAHHPNRDTVTTIREDGSRRFLYPADVRGRFSLARRISALLLIAVYALLPWIPVGGYPAVFLDVAARRFHLFGLTLAAQDIWLLFFLITGLGFLLFIVTALFGRLWCGWACPQTVFLDQVYRRIERWVEGDGVQRRTLADAPWGPGKIARAAVKHAAYIVVSLGIAHLFLAYYVSIPALWAMMTGAPGRHWAAFVFIALATGVVYFNFAWFREQLCIIICPYGRLQSVLTDDHTLIIGYDAARGEPRGPAGAHAAGDCIACDRCVRVCPTGIDIRQGLQMECIGCAACVDACDEVMAHTGRPPGLVRYDSLAGLARKPKRIWRPRLAIYSVLLLFGATAATWGVLSIHPVLLTAIRLTGAPYYLDQGIVRNQYLVRLVNKQNSPATVRLDVSGLRPGASARGVEDAIEVPPMGEELRPLIIEQSRSTYQGPFAFRVHAADPAEGVDVGLSLEFLGPATAGSYP